MGRGQAAGWPQHPDVGVIGVVPDPWEGPFTVRHQVMTRLCRAFRAVWLEPPAHWREGLRDRSLPLIERVWRHPSGLAVYRSGRLLPKLYRPRPLAALVDRQRLARAARLLRRQGCRKLVLYVWRPELGYALDALSHDLSLYHIDDEYTFSFEEQPLSAEERALIERADEVIVHSPALLAKKGHINPRTTLIPNGVDYRAFSSAAPEPAELAAIPHPRVGYVGIIKRQLDLALMDALSERHPDWSFVFVGPIGTIGDDAPVLTRLQNRANAYFLGGKEVTALPAYVQHMDVCTMGYKLNDYTKFIYPLKLHEYLAAGRPVVATPIRTLQGFADSIALAEGEDAWSAALEAALEPAEVAPDKLAARRRIAREHDWDLLVERIVELLHRRL